MMPVSVSLPRCFVPAYVKSKHVVLCVLAIGVVAARVLVHQRDLKGDQLVPAAPVIVQNEIDARLHQTAIEALQQREGTILLVDPQTGRIRSVINPQMAFERAFAPGSTIKPFVALAALRAGIINRDSRTLCGEKYEHEGFQTVCSHPRHLGPFNPTEAIAYSCNYYFARLGERLSEQQLRTTLAQFGFGAKTGVNEEAESSGVLGRGQWRVQNALGEGEYVQTTPMQLLAAYSALVNGGRLLTPQAASAASFQSHIRTTINITEDEREVILAGLRGAIHFGTAEQTQLDSLPLYVIGKTGTSTPLNGFRTQGWFVGFAGNRADELGAPSLGVLVFLKTGRGKDAALVSRAIFEEYARLMGTQAPASNTALQDQVPDSVRTAISTNANTAAPVVRVHLAREDKTISLSLEDYVLGVVATEGSMETEGEALKALAVASRTFALRNIRRHSDQGYDFCNLTHCQRFLPPDQASDLVRSAVKQTEGEVLRRQDGLLVDSYFSASCGGQTANIAQLWGGRPQPELQGVTDQYCDVMPHAHWTDVISSKDLLRAIRSDPRTDVGGELKDVIVSTRDQTGRAQLITIVGSRRLTVRGWDFKIIVGRVLGWNLLKSSRFQISRAGSDYVFRGSGFGHGLGLCQEGTHVMSERGFNYRQILAKYFPGSVLTGAPKQNFAADVLWSRTPERSRTRSGLTTIGVSSPGLPKRQSWALFHNRFAVSPKPRLRITNEHFEINYPSTVKRQEAEELLQLFETSRNGLLRRPSLPAAIRIPFIQVFLNESTGDFVGRTGLSWWAAAATKGNRIELQPLVLLKRRGILETTIRHELVHKMIDVVGNERTPRWLAEGLALYLAGEGPMISRFQPKLRLSVKELEQRLATATNSDEMRELYAASYVEVQSLIRREGEADVWRRVSKGE